MGHGGEEEEEAEGGGERWLVSYSDFITLLMVMFVVLYSMGQTDVVKYKRLADSMRAAFSMGGAAKIVDSQINKEGGKSENGEPNPIVIPGIPKEPPASSEVAGQLTKMLSGSNLGGEVSIQTNVEGVLIALSEKMVFTPGTAVLQAEAYPVLDTIAKMLIPINRSIRVVGHTDNTPSSDPRYPTNWDLSLGRGMVIANYLLKAGIAPERIIVSGRGEYQPLFPNDTPAHRSLNSRAEIIIVYKVEENMIGVGQPKVEPPLSTPTNGQP
jgi:chemotaxis protein MotB